MVELRNVVIGLITFALIISLSVGMNESFQKIYHLDDTDTRLNEDTNEFENVGEAMQNLNLVQSLNQTISGPLDLDIPTGSFLDIVGSLAASGIGALKTIASIITLPVDIFNVVIDYYDVPPVLISTILIIIAIIVGFILLSTYIGRDV